MSLMDAELFGGKAQQPAPAPAEPVAGTGHETKPSTLAPKSDTHNELALVIYNGGGRLVGDISHFASRFILLPEPARWVLPLWIMHSYVFDQFEYTPYLNVVSPEPGCGKSTLAKIIKSLSRKGVTPTGSSAAALKRTIAADAPTLVLDEWDTLNPDVRQECKNFLNTGYERTGEWSIVAGGEVVVMSTFCPKAIIGRSTVALTSDTLARCFQWMMHKASKEDGLEPFRQDSQIEAEALRQRCEQWGEGFRRLRVRVTPLFPEGFDLRQRDISEPLLVIADSLGGDWPHRVREALTTLLDDRHRQELTPENQLLRAIKKMLAERQRTRVPGATLPDFFWSLTFCAWANKQEERPWSPDKPLTPSKLAALLRTYDIHSEQISWTRAGVESNCHGYRIAWFKDAFERYTDGPLPDR